MRLEVSSYVVASLRGLQGRSNLVCILACVLLFAVAAFAAPIATAPKSASAYYSDAAFQYIENRLPSAEITCNEGLNYYPNDQKLQMLLDRIQEAKDEQQKENQKNDKNQDNQDQNNQDQQDQGDQNQDQNKDDGQNGSSDSEGSSNSESSSDSQNDDQNQQGQGGESSSSESGSSDGNGGAGEEPQPEQPEENSSDSNGGDENQPEPQPQMGEMTPEEASQLLKDFDEQNGERRPWKPIRGQARPAKDW